jgi:hypothetical protein
MTNELSSRERALIACPANTLRGYVAGEIIKKAPITTRVTVQAHRHRGHTLVEFRDNSRSVLCRVYAGATEVELSDSSFGVGLLGAFCQDVDMAARRAWAARQKGEGAA